jgi:hypothetical protein
MSAELPRQHSIIGTRAHAKTGSGKRRRTSHGTRGRSTCYRSKAGAEGATLQARDIASYLLAAAS